MSYRISIVSEQHGYTIRLEKTDYELDAKDVAHEKTETIATLAIINRQDIALEVFKTLDSFLKVLVKHKILKENVFRMGSVQK